MDSNGNSYPAIQYTFNGYRYFQTELESDKSDKGLYATTDDYGTSYYYRGSVNNNYVSFAGYYWRIIRINGDGSIRLLYSGASTNENGQNIGIGISKFNDVDNKPLYVGYMYGDINGTTLDEINANVNDSAIKSYIDSWYEENLIGYSSYIADSGFCNDRTLSTRSNNGNGVTTSVSSYYGANDRAEKYTPILQCPNTSNDLFTVSNEIGNQSLTYPIGLITSDELMHAGNKIKSINRLNFLYANVNYITMSPLSFTSGDNHAFTIAMNYGYMTVNGNTGNSTIRPVINLNANVEITGGIGTQNEPFVVKTS